MVMDNIVFLDRDGVINRNIDHGYVTSWAEFDFLPNVFEALRKLTSLGFEIIITSNQAGISKGLYTQQALATITEKMLDMIKNNHGQISAVYYCNHRDEDECICRKPKPGLFKRALVGKSVNHKDVYVIGDSERDIEAGKSLGFRTILVLSGKIKKREEVRNFKAKPDYIAEDLLDAVERVIEANLKLGKQ